MSLDDFIQRWKFTQASERANKDSFLKELCRAIGVPEPDGKTGDADRDHYVFEADAVLVHEEGRHSVGNMDLYKRGCFVLEAKQGSDKGKKIGTARRGTPGWNVAMTAAAGQAFGYARTLGEVPPFIIVADLGYCFDIYANFDGTGAYRAFPNAQRNRLFFSDLAKHVDVLRSIWLDPMSLDPRRQSEKVTREVAERIAELARELERAGHPPELVAKFLMRCLFTMFAEDIGLLKDGIFAKALSEQWIPEPDTFKDGVEALWEAMNAGTRFFLLGKLLHFNGGLFANPVALPLTAQQLELLHAAARCSWADVEPAIFGTLLERALDPEERHRLGAHFTPRSYVERVLVPTIEEPLRADWDLVRVAIRELIPADQPAKTSDLKKAQDLVRKFHTRLCNLRVLDPACGSGNFLYVALDLFKRLESEVLGTLYELGVSQRELGEELLVTPKQFLGIELRQWSKEIAELVLWIGYLQWHHRTYGGMKAPPEPVLRDYRNVEHRDALLVPHATSTARGRTTSLSMMDQANWPHADFIVGNPPFLGKLNIVSDLGTAYAAALRNAYAGDVPDSSDLVMYWWAKAARLVANGKVRRFGFVTTNSITQTFNRRVVSAALEAPEPIHLVFAIPDHPWVDTANGASVRVAITVGAPGEGTGTLCTLSKEAEVSEFDGAVNVTLSDRTGVIHANLRIGADVAGTMPLASNAGLTGAGVMLGGRGFIVPPDDTLPIVPSVTKQLLNGNDILQASRRARVIDFHGKSEAEARVLAPKAFQRLLDRVKPERDKNRRATRRERWWLFSEAMQQTRGLIHGLPRYIATPETARHRIFTFVDGAVLPEHPLLAIGLDDPFFLGVLSSRVHVTWSLATGGRLGVGNDPRYNKTVCFEPFPFPECTSEQSDRIRDFAEALDEHRKKQLSLHPELTLTGMYNVLAKQRTGEKLNIVERSIHENGLVSILRQLHDQLDAAVCDAYGWPRDMTDDEILKHVVALNHVRVAEEAAGTTKWLRPDFQRHRDDQKRRIQRQPAAGSQNLTLPWPNSLPQQVAAVRDLLNGRDNAMSASEVAAEYEGATTKSVVAALDTLDILGAAASFRHERQRRWKGLAKIRSDRPNPAALGPGLVKAPSRPPPLEDEPALAAGGERTHSLSSRPAPPTRGRKR